MKAEVRCCCTPRKLLGWLEVPTLDADRVVFWLRFAMDRWEDPPRRIELPIAEFIDERKERRRAIKAEGVPIELLRRIPGFIEFT